VGVEARSRDATAGFVAQKIFTRKRLFSFWGVFNSSFSPYNLANFRLSVHARDVN